MIGIARQQADEVAQRRKRSVENVGRMAVVDDAPLTKKVDLEAGKRFLPFRRARSNLMSPRDQQRAMQAVGSDGISGGELPMGKNRLNDFKSVRNPIHAGHKR